jgi:hypothetical protein
MVALLNESGGPMRSHNDVRIGRVESWATDARLVVLSGFFSPPTPPETARPLAPDHP